VIGLALLTLFAGGFLAAYIFATIEAGVALKVGLTALLIWGPIFGAIAWATRRALRNSSHATKRRK
jgi:hypothetical protein